MKIENFENSRMAKLIDGCIIVAHFIRSLPARYMARQARKLDENRAFYIKNNADFERMQRHAIFYLG
jgi:hypothetical protein